MANGLSIRIEQDEYGLPVVSWVEPKHIHTTFLGLNTDYFTKHRCKCWIGINTYTGMPVFVYQDEKVHGKKGMPPVSAAPFDDLTGFSLHTSTDLYCDGETSLPVAKKAGANYRDDLVLTAELGPVDGLPPIERKWIPKSLFR
jgi:hypothetical protein